MCRAASTGVPRGRGGHAALVPSMVLWDRPEWSLAASLQPAISAVLGPAASRDISSILEHASLCCATHGFCHLDKLMLQAAPAPHTRPSADQRACVPQQGAESAGMLPSQSAVASVKHLQKGMSQQAHPHAEAVQATATVMIQH